MRRHRTLTSSAVAVLVLGSIAAAAAGVKRGCASDITRSALDLAATNASLRLANAETERVSIK